MDFAPFDQRRYPVLGVRDGYAQWARTYEGVVPDEMDIRLLERLRAVDWRLALPVLELACGTGRIGRWLRQRGVTRLDGLDFTPEMLAQAAAKGVYDRLLEADLLASGLADGGYGMVVMVLADEHLADLRPLYRETARLTGGAGTFVILGYHSHFLMNGVPTHFEAADGAPRTVESHVHLFSDQVRAALAAGWQLAEMTEGVVDDAWIRKKPKWERYRFHPVSYAMVWRKPAGADSRSRGRRGIAAWTG